jgi:hypothetical protein
VCCVLQCERDGGLAACAAAAAGVMCWRCLSASAALRRLLALDASAGGRVAPGRCSQCCCQRLACGLGTVRQREQQQQQRMPRGCMSHRCRFACALTHTHTRTSHTCAAKNSTGASITRCAGTRPTTVQSRSSSRSKFTSEYSEVLNAAAWSTIVCGGCCAWCAGGLRLARGGGRSG